MPSAVRRTVFAGRLPAASAVQFNWGPVGSCGGFLNSWQERLEQELKERDGVAAPAKNRALSGKIGWRLYGRDQGSPRGFKLGGDLGRFGAIIGCAAENGDFQLLCAQFGRRFGGRGEDGLYACSRQQVAGGTRWLNTACGRAEAGQQSPRPPGL